jgi:hypothetical protein
MQNRNFYIFLTLISVVVLNIIFLTKEIKQRYLLSELKQNAKILLYRNHTLEERIVQNSILPNDLFLVKKAISLTDTNGKVIALKDLPGYSQKQDLLIFRFSDSSHCSTCIIESIGQLKNNLNGANIDFNRIALFSTDNDFRNLIITKRKFDIHFNIYYVSSEFLPQELENRNEPYFFVLTKEFEMKYIFLIQYELLQLNTSYLQAVSKIIFK